MEEQHDLANFDPAFGAIAEPNNVSDHDFSKAAPARTSDLEADTASGAEAETACGAEAEAAEAFGSAVLSQRCCAVGGSAFGAGRGGIGVAGVPWLE